MTSATTVAGQLVLSLRGEIDMATIPRLHGDLSRVVTGHPGAVVALDIDGVYACDDSGLGVLLGAAARARDLGGDIVVVCHSGSIRDRLARTGFDRAVSVVAEYDLL